MMVQWLKLTRLLCPKTLKLQIGYSAEAMCQALQAIHKRSISLVNVQYIAWSKARFSAMQNWLDKVIAKAIAGGMKGRDASEIYHRVSVMCEESMQTGPQLVSSQKQVC